MLLRILALAITGASLYLVAPALIEVFSSWDRLRDVSPGALGLMVLLEAGSLACVCLLQWLALRRPPWGPVITSQLAGNGFAKIVPGGGTAGSALQYAMLKKAGVDTGAAVSALTAVNLLTFATLLALPVLALPAIVLGTAVPHDLMQGLWIALAGLLVLFPLGVLLLATDRPLREIGTLVQGLRNRIAGGREPLTGVPARLIEERDSLLQALGRSLWEALAASIGRWLLDFAALVVAVYAVDAHPPTSLVLIAFVTAQVLAQIPVTPGGLGFVEAGLTATLALAGMDAGEAVLATLAYRLASYWLPLPAGAVAWAIHRRRWRSDRLQAADTAG